jgi:hypothetical protein
MFNSFKLKFYNCNITSFHPSIFTISSRSHITFWNCNLSETSIQSLNTLLANVRSRFTIGINGNLVLPVVVDNVKVRLSLEEVVNRLFTLSGSNNEIPRFENVTCNQHLTGWLNKIYKSSTTTIIKQLIPHILEMMIEMNRNQEFMEEACNIIYDATITCGDRMILSILYISLQFKMHVLTHNLNNINEIANFLVRGPFILSQLEKIARKKVQELQVRDAIEIFLAYPIKLRDRFNIPIEIKDMLYYQTSSIDSVDLDEAATIIDAELRNNSSIVDFLSTQPLWTKIISSINPDILDDIDTLQDNLIKETSKIISNMKFV